MCGLSGKGDVMMEDHGLAGIGCCSWSVDSLVQVEAIFMMGRREGGGREVEVMYLSTCTHPVLQPKSFYLDSLPYPNTPTTSLRAHR
jgi:hypothetical protein